MGKTSTPVEMPFPKNTFSTQVAMNVSVTSPVGLAVQPQVTGEWKWNLHTNDDHDEHGV